MSDVNNTIETIEETKDALVETANETESGVVKYVLLGAGCALVIAGTFFGVRRYFAKKKVEGPVDTTMTEEDIDESNDEVDNSETESEE